MPQKVNHDANNAVTEDDDIYVNNDDNNCIIKMSMATMLTTTISLFITISI